MKDGRKKRIVKEIHVNVDKCTGCRACELACSAFHAMPKYSTTNPAKARIRVIVDEFNDVYVPMRAGYYSAAECAGRCAYTINGKTYSECGFCKVACPSRGYFTDPDSGLPLKCDMCEGEEEPLCVKWCIADALIYEEREEDAEDEESPEELEIGLESLADKFGMEKIQETLSRMITSKKD